MTEIDHHPLPLKHASIIKELIEALIAESEGECGFLATQKGEILVHAEGVEGACQALINTVSPLLLNLEGTPYNPDALETDFADEEEVPWRAFLQKLPISETSYYLLCILFPEGSRYFRRHSRKYAYIINSILTL